MNQLRPPRPELESLVPYDAREVKAEVVLASNEHPSNLPSEIVTRLAERLHDFAFNRYPDPTAHELRRVIGEANGLDETCVLLGNGGDELIFDLLLAWGGPGRTLLDMPPTFSMYGIDAEVTGTSLVRIPRKADFSVDEAAVLARVAEGDIDVVMIANPNNPTGALADETFLIDLLNATDALVLVDEAYFEFSRHTMRPHMTRHKNLVLLRTFSKAFSLAGLRLGYVLAHEDVITRAHEGAPALLGGPVRPVGGLERLQRASGLRGIHPRDHPRPRPAAARPVGDGGRPRLPERGQLRAVPGRARAGGVARSAPRAFRAGARSVAQPGA